MRLGFVALVLALLAACGGGGGGGGSTAPAAGGDPPSGSPPAGTPAGPFSTPVSGTVAGNSALADYEVQLLAPAFPTPSAGAVAATTQGDGSYSLTVTTLQGPPFIIQAGRPQQETEPQYQQLTSIALRDGTVNVTPLTHLLVTRILNRKPLSILIEDLAALPELRNVSDADLSAARQEVLTYLLSRPSRNNGNETSPVNLSEVTDFVSMPLSATQGDPHFEALKRLHGSLMDTETIQGVEEHMLFHNDAAAELSPMLAFDFMADCSFFGSDKTLPNGVANVVVNQPGVTLGSLNFPFQTGTPLDVFAFQPSGQSWVFTFGSGTTTFVDLLFLGGQLFSAGVSTGQSRSICVPQSSNPTVPSRLPSLTALIKRFTSAVDLPGMFQCSSPTVFFRNGSNHVSIEANGALRFNGANGPALHLPSMDITLRSELVVAAGALTIRTKSMDGRRFFKGGSDQVQLFLDNARHITSVFLVRQKDGLASQFQSCGII